MWPIVLGIVGIVGGVFTAITESVNLYDAFKERKSKD